MGNKLLNRDIPIRRLFQVILTIPDKFKEYLLEAAGACDTPLILDAIQNREATVSIRINPLKGAHGYANCVPDDGAHNLRPRVPWCKDGYYLSERPIFTLDPALHAGAYYVQEPSSMFLAVLEPVFNLMKPQNLLDLCAAPGGKTTHLISMMPRGSKLIANEVIKSRMASLKENVIKWGDHSVEVTNRDARDFVKMRNRMDSKQWISNQGDSDEDRFSFDFILVDAPCSGEGMFRKDPSAVNEWSEENVKLCAARQKRILADIWRSLKPGGLLAYSTCTFNRYENDDNIAWLKSEYGANIFDLYGFYKSNGIEDKFNPELVKEWGTVPTKEGGFQFFPGLAKGEGFFFALLQKAVINEEFPDSLQHGARQESAGQSDLMKMGQPKHEYALSISYAGEWPSVELSREDALQYLSRNSIKLEDAPLGYLRVTYNGLGLGFVKNLGNRANNLYPMNWRIRMDIR